MRRQRTLTRPGTVTYYPRAIGRGFLARLVVTLAVTPAQSQKPTY